MLMQLEELRSAVLQSRTPYLPRYQCLMCTCLCTSFSFCCFRIAAVLMDVRHNSRSDRVKLDEEDDSDVEFSFDGVNLKPHRLDRFGRPQPQTARRSEADFPDEPVPPAQPLAPVQVRVTPYIPRKNARAIRERSWEALEASRRHVERETGVPPRLVVDSTTGMLLPRDQVVGAEEPLHRGIETQHYRRSLDVVGEIRAERMMRFFQGA